METVETNQTKMSDEKRRILAIIIGGLILILLVGGGFYYFEIFRTKKNVAKAQEIAKQGKDLAWQAKYSEAIPLCQEAMKLDSNNIAAYECLLRSYDTLRTISELEKLSKDYIEKKPQRINGYLYLSHSYEMQGRFNEAAEWAEKAIELFPKNSNGYNRLGHVLDRQGNLELAQKNYETAISINPQNAYAHQNLGRVFSRLTDYEKAKEEYELAKKYSPPKGYIAMESRLNLGYIAYQYENNVDKAIEYFKEAIEADPNVAMPYVNLARRYYYLDKVEEAISLYEKAMKLDDQLTRPYLDLAEVYLREGKSVDEAIELLEGAEKRLRLDHSISVRNTERPANINYFFAAAYAKKGDLDKAFEYLEKAFRYDKKTLLGEETPAVKINKDVGKNIFTDPLFTEMKKDPRFSELISSEKKTSPNL